MSKYVSLAAAAAVAAVALTTGSVSSQAVPFDFFKIGGNGDDIGDQLRVDVTDNLDGRVRFEFSNLGPTPSAINDIYFADGTLLGLSEIDDAHLGVDFRLGADPENLPGGSSLDPPFITTVEFNTQPAVPQPQANAVDPGEWVAILFTLKSTLDFNDTIAALLNQTLRIGLQVQGIGSSGGSAQFVNNPNPIPLPAGLVLFLSGLAGIGVLGRYKAKRRETAVI